MTSFAKERGGEIIAMAPNIKLLLWLVGLLLVSLWCQGSLNASSYTSTSQESVSILSTGSASTQRELETTVLNELLRKEKRSPIREDEFWLTETDAAVLPFDVDYVPPDALWGELEPMWSCNDNATRTKKLIFVNIVRTEALAFQELLSSYASSCRAGFISTGKSDTFW